MASQSKIGISFVVTFSISHFVVVTAILDDTADEDPVEDEDETGI